jgi:cyclopropane-fatty-acyl-phospholipid synthase
MRYILDAILKRFIVMGQLSVTWPDGTTRTYAGPPGSGPAAGLMIADDAAVRSLVLNPLLALGEAYMNGTAGPAGCSLYDMLDVLMLNLDANGKGHPVARARDRWGKLIRRIEQFNPAGRARRNVEHHYDLNGRLYSLFLDRDRQYSCAYFRRGDETLEEAQIAKKRHIAAKLRLNRPDLEILDIGCGWGGLALTLARDHGARVLGITLSHEQLDEARARAAAEGLGDRVRFELMDYRAVAGTFDRVVSVGMFEHVGVGYYPAFFDAVARLIRPDGVALLHYIGRTDGPGRTNPWISKYIFPGGYCPALSEVMGPIEQSGLMATDIEVLRIHYAETLRHWRWRFAANRDAIASLYDERFCRMFEMYLAGSELTFRREWQVIHQIQLAKRGAPLPITRDYIVETERQEARETADASGG